MALQKGTRPEPLDPEVAKKLLDLLSTDDAFRELFTRDAHAALVQAGWQAPAGKESDADQASLSGGACLRLPAARKLASKESIAHDRLALERALSSGGARFSFDCPQELQG